MNEPKQDRYHKVILATLQNEDDQKEIDLAGEVDLYTSF